MCVVGAGGQQPKCSWGAGGSGEALREAWKLWSRAVSLGPGSAATSPYDLGHVIALLCLILPVRSRRGLTG